MKFTKVRIMNASAAKVWQVFAHDFDDAYLWMASVPRSYAQANGEAFAGASSAGRVCELDDSPKSLKASEKFLAYDESKRTCTVRIDFLHQPAFFPVDHNEVDFSVVDLEDGRSEMRWAFRSEIKPWAFWLWPIIRLGFGVFVGQIVEELQYYVEHDAPHPRKVKAIGKAQLAASA